MREKAGIEKRYRAALAAGLVVVVLLQAALFAWGGADDADAERSERPTAQLVDLPENDAPLADIAEILTPEPEEETAPRQADVLTMAAIPSIPKLSAAMANAVQPVMFMENLDEPEADENPAVTYASVSQFVAPGSENAQPLRPIDDRPAAILAMVGNRGRGIGADGPHCLPGEGGRPRMFTRSQVVSGAPSILRSGM
ncbi:MAG: hypothetical protein KJO44_08405 [Gemmatimonadetes bacterium]|nr:hypothetical protein [Gemmatimonadota bacterium]